MVARAALFLECARFVHRCNRGNWPEWMKGHHVNITKKGLSRGRSPIVGNKRNQKLQWNAAKLFYQWGDVSVCSSSIHTKMCRNVKLIDPIQDFSSSGTETRKPPAQLTLQSQPGPDLLRMETGSLRK